MANEITKCPMCGTKLKMMNGRMTCKKCGYYVRSQEGPAGAQTPGQGSSPGQYGSSGQYSSSGQYGASGQYGSSGQSSASGQYSSSGQSGASGQYSSSGQSAQNRSGSSTWQNGSSPQKNAEHNPVVGIVVACVAGLACVAVLVVIIMARSGAFRNMLPALPDSDSLANSSAMQSDASDNAQASVSSSAEGEKANASMPTSGFFQQVAEYIWDKPCASITAQEYASLTAIQIDRDEKSISYQLDHGETQTVTYQTDAGMALSDLSCFTGLEWISIDDDLQPGDLKGLRSLYGLYSENTLEEQLKIVPNPEYITNLGITDTFLKSSLAELDSFPNLEYLSVDYAGLEDISALEGFPSLLGLTLENCDRLTDFSPLMTLTNLEQLSIESPQLKSIDFVRNMPMLTDLSIESGQLTSIDALEDCPALEYLYLYLDEAYSMNDYSVIGNLMLLKELVLEMDWGHNSTLPSFANLTDLEYLSVKNAGDLTPLQDAQNVVYLSLENCSGNTFETIASLQSLTALYINDFSSYVSSLEPLTRLPNLTILSLEETSVFGNVEEIFGIPTLNYLYLEDCQIGLDFDNLPTNETLTALSLSDTSILHDPTYNNGNTKSLSDHYDMFDHFPNLTELYLASQQIDSIDFVEKLPSLQYLDITDNNVTSLKPLEQLSDFQAVWCGRNTILENPSEDSDIAVYTTED